MRFTLILPKIGPAKLVIIPLTDYLLALDFTCLKYSNTAKRFAMKATLDIPDALYRRVKAKSAMAGHPAREVAIRLFSEWVEEPVRAEPDAADAQQKLPAWFGAAHAYAAKVRLRNADLRTRRRLI